METKRRMFVGGLYEGVQEEDLQSRFKSFGSISDIDIRTKKDAEGNIVKTFAYIDIQGKENDFKKCVSLLSKCKWKGSELQLQPAKQSFLTRLKMEQENQNNEVVVKKKRMKPSHDKDVLTASTVPRVTKPDNQKWVRGKAGKLVPVLNVRQPNSRKLVKNDPTQHQKNIKKLDRGNFNNAGTTSVQNLTWTLESTEEKKQDIQVVNIISTDSDSDSFCPPGQSEKNLKVLVNRLQDKRTQIQQKRVREYKSSSESEDEIVTIQEVFVPSKKQKKPSLNLPDKTIHMNKKNYLPVINISDSDDDNNVDTSKTNTKSDIAQKKYRSVMVKEKSNVSLENKMVINIPSSSDDNSDECVKDKPRHITKNLMRNTKSPVDSGKLGVVSFVNDDDSGDCETLKNVYNSSTDSDSQNFNTGPRKINKKEKVTEKKIVSKSNISDEIQHKKQKSKRNSTITLDSLEDSKHAKKPKTKQNSISLDSLKIKHVSMESCIEKQHNIETETTNQSSVQYSEKSETVGKEKVLKKNSNMSDSESDVPDIETWVSKTKSTIKQSVNKDNSHSPSNLIKKIDSIERTLPVRKNVQSKKAGNEYGVPEKMLNRDTDDTNTNSDITESDDFEDELNNQKTLPGNYSNKSDSEMSDNNFLGKKHIVAKTNSESNLLLPRSNMLSEYSTGMKACNANDTTDSEEDDILDSIAAGNWGKIKQLATQKPNTKLKSKTSEKILTEKGTIEYECTKDKIVRKQVVTDSKIKSKSTTQKEIGIDPVVESKLTKSETAKQQHKDTPKENKQSEKSNQLKHEASNVKRLESVREKQKQALAQKSLIQKALSAVDNVEKNKKIVFDSENDSSDTEVAVQQPTKTGSSIIDKNIKTSSQPTLFASDESEDDTGSQSDTDRFNIKPQFEGKHGSKLMKLQSRFGNDERFKLDPRFTRSDNEESSAEEDDEKPQEKSEKQKSMEVLESVIGRNVKMDPRDSKHKAFKDINTLHYDPSREDHQQFEIKSNPAKPKKKKKDGKESVPIEEVPTVSKEKFYQVDSSLQNIFKKIPDEDQVNESEQEMDQEEKPFSLLAMYGNLDVVKDASKDCDNSSAIWQPLPSSTTTMPWQDNYDSSADEEGDSKNKGDETKMISKITSCDDETFFFTVDDPRILEGIEFFCRTEPLEELREKWQEKRPQLVESYRLKRKRSIRKNRETQKFQAKFKKKKFMHNKTK